MMSIVPTILKDEKSDARRHKLALQSAGISTWEWDLKTDAVVADEGFRAMFNVAADAPMTAQTFTENIHSEDQPGLQAALEECFASDTGEFNYRFRVQSTGDEWQWLQGKGQVSARDADGEAIKLIGINYDVTDIAKYEDRLTAIAGEMRHRVKNSLAMVNALASATAREAETLDEFLGHFRGRVDAIAAAQRISETGKNDIGVDCASAVDGGLAPFKASAEWARRITIEASTQHPLQLSLGQAITLAIYEFATNSVKYGALSDKPGQINIAISQEQDELIVDWHETFAPGATIDTSSTGFGSTLITRLVRAERGRIERQLTEEALRVKLIFPLID